MPHLSGPLATLERLRARRPLVHCITNGVTAGLVANALLALGAVPAMVEGADEVAGFAARAGALAINLGTLTPVRAEGMRSAAMAAREAGVPWVLDPVAAGALPNRARFGRELLAHRPAVVRGNASEVPGLLDGQATLSGQGPDADAGAPDPVPAARDLARHAGTVVAVTGAVDRVVDASGRLASVGGGHPLMARVSGVGCAATAIVAACLAAEPDPFAAATHALALLAAAGSAAARDCPGPGSYAWRLLDALAGLDAAMLEAARVME